jgi:two-component system, NarL family, sensor histidine kinase UhpB
VIPEELRDQLEELRETARHGTEEVRRIAPQDAIVLTVADDGRGLGAGEATSSHGIRGMRERAMLVGGTLEIDSRPERGTAITLTIPR